MYISVWLFLYSWMLSKSCRHAATQKLRFEGKCTRILQSHWFVAATTEWKEKENSTVHHFDLSIANLPRQTRQRIWCLTLQPAKSD